ncbi:MAG: DUF1499 domain-containing protein [Rhodobacterales bacterium]
MVIIYLVLLGVIGLMAYVRLAPNDPAVWHQNPETAVSTGKPNEYRLIGGQAPIFNMAAPDLATLVDNLIAAQARVTRLAGSPETLMMTYVQRSMSMGYPDYITFKIVPVGDEKSKLEILSRARFGRSDLGVNKRRVEQWVGLITGLVAGR